MISPVYGKMSSATEAFMKTEKRMVNGKIYYYAETTCEICGKSRMISKSRINKIKFCQPCGNRLANTKHGLSKSPLYPCWAGMKDRCNKPNHIHYRYYGGKGITICEEWNDFENFYNDLKDTFFEGATLDRIDPNKGYYKENCRWLTRSDNLKHRHGTYKG